VGQDDEDQQATHFDRKFSIPPCPAVVTYNPVPAISFDEEGTDNLRHWKEIKLLNGTTILARRVTSLNCRFERPEDSFSLLPFFSMPNIRDFSSRLNSDLDLKLSRLEEHHATDVKETIERLNSQSDCIVKERDALKSQLRAARNQLKEMQSELALERNAPPVTVNPAAHPVVPVQVVEPPVAAPLPSVSAATPHGSSLEAIERHLKSLSSTVHYMQRNQQSHVPPRQFFQYPIPEFHSIGPLPIPSPIGPVHGNGVPRSRNNRNRNRNRKRNGNRNRDQPNTESTVLFTSDQSSASEQNSYVHLGPNGSVNDRGEGAGRGRGRGRGRGQAHDRLDNYSNTEHFG
jgi:hypothetical protein